MRAASWHVLQRNDEKQPNSARTFTKKTVYKATSENEKIEATHKKRNTSLTKGTAFGHHLFLSRALGLSRLLSIE